MNGRPINSVPPQTKTRANAVVDAAVAFIKTQRGGPGNGQGRIPRVAIENAAAAATGLNQSEIDAALIEVYDQCVALGLVPPRA